MASMAAASTAAKASFGQRVASVFREAHPIGRVPKFLKAHDTPGAMFYVRRLGRTGVVFAPFMIGFLGWPFLMQYTINSGNGVYASKSKKAAASHKMSRKSSIDSEAWSQKAPA